MALRYWPLALALAFTLYSAGVIWFMQIIEYPLFALVGREAFPAFHAAHNQRLPFVVIGPMLVAFASSFALIWLRPAGMPGWAAWTGAALCCVVLAATAARLVPLHLALSANGYSADVIRSLVAWNWVRTVAWTLHGVLLLWVTLRLAQAPEARAPAAVHDAVVSPGLVVAPRS